MMRKPWINKRLTITMFCLNGLFMLIGIAILILGIHASVDNANISEMSGSTLYSSGLYIIIFASLIMMLIALFGCVAVYTVNRCLLLMYAVAICLLILPYFISAILVLSYRDSLGSTARNIMITTLKSQYGRYRLVTDAWNLTQTKLRCCGVNDLGWDVYRGSWWDRFANNDIYETNATIPRTSLYYKFVPESCCQTKIDALTGWPTVSFRDLPRCQNWQYGPPGQTSGAHNDAIYYAGCFESLRNYIGMYGKALGSLVMLILFILIAALVCTIVIILKSRKRSNKHSQPPFNNQQYENIND